MNAVKPLPLGGGVWERPPSGIARSAREPFWSSQQSESKSDWGVAFGEPQREILQSLNEPFGYYLFSRSSFSPASGASEPR